MLGVELVVADIFGLVFWQIFVAIIRVIWFFSVLFSGTCLSGLGFPDFFIEFLLSVFLFVEGFAC